MKVTYWFKAHKSGYGWHPASWQGWVVLGIYVFTVIYSYIKVDAEYNSAGDIFFNFLPRFLFLTVFLIIVTYLKGESIVWGEKEKDQHKIP